MRCLEASECWELDSGVSSTAELPANLTRRLEFVERADEWTRLHRFLLWGHELPQYAAGGVSTPEAGHGVFRCLVSDGPRVVREVTEVLASGVAASDEPALFLLALAAADRASARTREAALAAVPACCGTSRRLFQFARFASELRGWGRGLRSAVADWYERPIPVLVEQMLACGSADGWSHRDLLRLSHPVPRSDQHSGLFRWLARSGRDGSTGDDRPLARLQAAGRLSRVNSVPEAAALIREFKLPESTVPRRWRREAAVWEAILERSSLRDLLASVGEMKRAGLLLEGSDLAAKLIARLGTGIRTERIQPIQVLQAMGHQRPPPGKWEQCGLKAALETAFRASLGNVRSTGKRWLVATDVSGSMASSSIIGMPGVTPREVSAAMALSVVASESSHTLLGFVAGKTGPGGRWGGGHPRLALLDVAPWHSLSDAERHLSRLPMGGVDCALPILAATRERLPVDVFVVLTDADTWSAGCSPVRAIREYRERMGIAAKLIVVGMASDGINFADPDDSGMLDVAGFDAAVPGLISKFVEM